MMCPTCSGVLRAENLCFNPACDLFMVVQRREPSRDTDRTVSWTGTYEYLSPLPKRAAPPRHETQAR